ncbi:uncharacterized protein YjaZ [Microbacterium sp. AG1240]|uniref:DUF2268 domain-containing protein n=1 Tax=Microbacterium sp. AG1240 TaxID=2183992 RepID=UPI000EB32AAD|nr:DUF2268 domain-containing putative Zn-dependent protease [Microbacterium sp. AG1240]RKT37179.1 uncharacterized protein YjaZ [Microbacterium sp. AG1240]
MTITVLDTARGIASVLDASPSQRAEVLRGVLTPMEGMFRYFPGEVDLVALHAMSSGFPVDERAAEVRDALSRLVDADAWGRTERALREALDTQTAATPGITVPDITFLLMLGDPGAAYFMGPSRGFSGNGSVTGYISITLWPTDENLDRLEAAAVHELQHNLRYAPGGVVWDPATVVVGEQVVSEGLADAFARQLYGDLGYTPFGVPHLADEAVFDKVVTGLDVGGMHNFAAWVHGDEAASLFGGTPVGLPTAAGYAVGNRFVDAYLAETGLTAAEALHVPSAEVIDVALRVLR